ncbi:BppU family phage baseplate upper protein [Limosilactobacillus fermentum]
MSQTLTYTIGSDRRALVDNIQDFKVDFGDDNQNWVQARQFERGMRQVFVNIVNEDGTPFDLTGCNVWFEGLLPNTANGDFRVIDSDGYVPLDQSSGKFRFDMPGQAFTVAGSYRQAFFRIVKNGNSVTTLEFDLDVLADKVIDGLVPKDWIGPFEQIADQLVDDLQKHTDAADKIISDFQQKVTDLVNQLNQQGSTTTSMLTELQNRVTDLETKIKQDGLFTQAEAETFENGIQDTITKSLSSYGLNVKDFGATGNGTTDDTKAFQDALDKANSGTIKRVLIPDGEYVITTGLIIPDGVSVVGIGSERSTILSAQGISFLLELGSNSNITNFTMYSLNNGKDITLLKLGNDGRGVHGCYVDRIYQHGSNQIKTCGVRSAVTNANIFDNTINVVQEIMYDGVLLSSNKTSWINGNDIDVTTIGFAHSSVYLTSSDDSSLTISQNNIKAHYEAINDAEGPTYVANNIVGVLVEFGDRNHFNLRSWDDDGKGVRALSVFPTDTTKNLNGFRDNVFEGHVESDIITNFYTAHANDFSNLRISKTGRGIFNGDYPQLHAVYFNAPRNLISDDLIANMAQEYSVPIFASKDVTNIYASYDVYGSFVQCNSNKGEMYIPLSGDEHSLIPGLAKLTVGFDVRFDVPENLPAITLRAGLSNFQSTTANRMDSTVEGRDVAVDTSMFGYRVVANVSAGDVSAYDIRALTLSWDGLQEGHIKVNRFFIVPGYINASQEVLLGRSSKEWLAYPATSQVDKFQDMHFYPMPDSLVINPMKFDPSKLSDLNNGKSYPVYY